MPQLRLFYRLMVRPLLHEPIRLGLTILAVALGVAVVLAIDLAGDAAAGSFRSSMETLTGGNDLEVVAAGGVPESLVATLAVQPYQLSLSPRMEDFAVNTVTNETVPLIGLDLIGEGNYALQNSLQINQPSSEPSGEESLVMLEDPQSIWVSPHLGKGVGEHLALLVNDKVLDCVVRGVLPEKSVNEDVVLMDIAGAQRALGRFGHVDRILIKLPPGANVDQWQKRLGNILPAGVEVRPQGTGTQGNRKMLAAFRWNLRLLSYIALVVGAFLIYNTISVSVVRRRNEIGILRALGASRGQVFASFLGEAACLGLVGAVAGLLLGRIMANGAVKLMSATVEALYVSSRPGVIALTSYSVALAMLVGAGVAIVSALSPAGEAMQVPPSDAMALGRREYVARLRQGGDLVIALLLAVAGALAAAMPSVGGKPLFGYLATVLLIVAAAYAIPALANFIAGSIGRTLGKLLGVEVLLASRGLAASLRRTSVLVGALATAVAMMVSVGIMVGSFRQTVVNWMASQLPADLYLRPAGNPAADRHPTISLELAERIAALPGVEGVERLRAYEISYEGMPVTLASLDLRVLRPNRNTDFFSGRPTNEVLAELRGKNNVVVSEPFAYKHKLKAGDIIRLALGTERVAFRIVDINYDYASERGYILIDRGILLNFLPDPTPTNLAVFLANGTDPEHVRREIQQVAAGYRILIFSNRDLRREAVRIFDRTFAITYALEAVAVLVAVMGVAGALIAMVIDRRKELGLLRFLGASSEQIRTMILVEAGLLGLLASLAGFVLGYFLSLILVFVINKQSFGWTIRFHWPVAVLLGALSVVYAATLISGLYPARVALRINWLEVLHEE